ncbi:AIM24 [Candida oxycetoniae]|uniref:Altered inheritance of mitochondria protein 24, mitochondrial n=1 Tax=Candida oxycetoniae TaxID=497107 RepID=A0AAI9WXD5_9ASCO|nr:AIM24 [Candida oxycetoniae]KAI3403958.2 AIM24 [Candida oxycetoniae]
MIRSKHQLFQGSIKIPKRNLITINHASVTSTSIPSQLPDTHAHINLNKTITEPINIQQAQLLTPYQTLEFAKFESLGVPPTILSIHSPPSVPVYLRRGSLLSIYGIKTVQKSSSLSSSSSTFSDFSSTPTIRNTVEFPLWRDRFIFNGGQIQSYQKLISTVPFSMLVGNKNSSKYMNEKSFVSLVLDGSTDWAILNKDAIQAYTGNALSVTMHRFPKYISTRIARFLEIDRIETGLRSFLHRGYFLLSGRGNVGVVGNGGVYQLAVGEGEEILIKKSAILGITVNGPFDLENCILKQESPFASSTQPPSSTPNTSEKMKKKREEENEEAEEAEKRIKIKATTEKPVLVQPSAWDQIVVQAKRFSWRMNIIWNKEKAFFTTVTNKINNFLLGNTEFVRVLGPRNILIQSNTNEIRKPYFVRSSNEMKRLEN